MGIRIKYGSRNIELLRIYFDQSLVLYISFISSIGILLIIIINKWWINKIGCYKFTTHAKLELLWTTIPIIFLLITVLHSISILFAIELDRGISTSYGHVIGNQWYWTYLQPINNIYNESRIIQSNNLQLGNSRLLLVDQPIFIPQYTNLSLEINSNDVIHSFSLPSLGIKVDAVPGRNSHISLTGLTKGIYIGFCSELCGSGHAFMPINLCIY